jgi:site-specific recombinase XerD
MDVVYIFNEGDRLRVPFFGYDPVLFSRLMKSGLGVWDNGFREFTFGTDRFMPLVNYVLSDIPHVTVNKNKSPQVTVGGFGFCSKNSGRGENGYFSALWSQKLETEMRVRKYSPHTISAYIAHNRALCAEGGKAPEGITTDDIKKYMARMEKYRHYSASSLNLALSAFKFFYGQVMKHDVVAEQKRPRQDKYLPVVLSVREVKLLFAGTANLKHRLLLMMVYASGLRVSEVVALKRENIDPARKTILVKGGKGRKDRQTVFSGRILTLLRSYCRCGDIKTWLFPGRDAGCHLSIRSAQRVFSAAMTRAGIVKDASIHSLRHSFATHLLEAGISIRYIKDLLGHTSVKTTERYTHVAAKRISAIASPLDRIMDGDSDDGAMEESEW